MIIDSNILNINFNNQEVEVLKFNGEIVWQKEPPIGDYDVLITFQDGTTRTDTYSSGIIPTSAYTNGTTIVSVEIGDGITEIGDYAFRNCSKLTSIKIGDSATRIGSYTFGGCSGLTSVEIPDSVTSIGASTFAKCTSLTSVTIPDSVTSIGNSAFENCSRLSSVDIGDSVTSIGNYTFRGCSSITSVTIPDSITSIGQSAFVSAPTQGTLYCSRYWYYNLSSTNISRLGNVYKWNKVWLDAPIGDYDVKLTFQGGTTRIDTYSDGVIPTSAYTKSNTIVGAEIGDRITSIGNSAFRDCSGLTYVDIGNSVTSIGNSAFNGCKKLINVTIPDSVTSIETYAFNNCRGLTSVTIPDSVETIGTYTFYGCSGLTSVDIGDSVTSIDKSVFSYCYKLTSVTIPDSVTSIGNDAFYYCSGLTYVDIGDSVTSIGTSAFNGCSKLTSVTIPNSVETIGTYTFNNCKGLTSAVIGDSVTSIGDCAFWSCSGLTSVTIPDSVTTIGSEVFCNCSGLTSVVIGDSVTNIGYGIFQNCTSLTSVTIPDSVTSINNYTFNGCTSLTSVTIPNSVTTIGTSAFTNVPTEGTLYCYQDWYGNLTSTQITNLGDVYKWNKVWLDTPLGAYDVRFTLEDGTTRTNNYEESGGVIPDNRYINNTTFTKVEFGDGIVSIGNWAFKNCSNCSEYIFSPTSNLQSIGDWCFESSFKYKEGYVFEVPNGVTYLGNGAFYNSGLARITLPNGLTVIDENTFNRCNILDEVTIPSSVTIIKSNAFKECGGLRDINLSNVEQIWSNAFENCGLETIVFPQSLQFVGDYAFLNCHNLKNVDLGGCETLYTGAFVQCDALEEIDLKNVSSLKYGALLGCSSLTSVTMNEITDIEHQIFNLCPNLVEIHYLGTSLPTTLYNTFEGIGENGTLYHPNVSDASQWLSTDEYYLGYYGWKDGNPPTPKMIVTLVNGNVETYKYDNGIIAENALCGRTDVVSVELDGIVEIGRKAFYNCQNLTSMTINEGVEVIGNDSLHNVGLTSLTLPSTLRVVDLWAFSESDAITNSSAITLNMTSEEAINNIYLGEGAFWTKRDIAILTTDDLVIYDYFTCINTHKFIANPNPPTPPIGYGQVRITYDDGTTRVDTYDDGVIPSTTYMYQTNITDVEIGEGITTIGGAAFSSCSNLKNLVLGSSLTSISVNVFAYCNNILKVEIPSGVTLIDDGAFVGCLKLVETNYLGTKAQWNSITKGSLWHYGCPFTVVHCSDGDVAVE